MGNMFRCTLKSGGASGTGIPLIVTCSETFAGLTITVTDGTTTLTQTCPSSSPYTLQFDLPNTGSWTVSGVVEGQTYSETISVTDFQISLETGFNYETWLSRGGLDPSDYASLSDVFADEAAVRQLMLVHASADYLIAKVSNDITVIDDFCANDTAMKWLGLCDYVCNGLTAITGVEAKLLASTYWERYLKDHVPVMFSNTAPYGEAISSGLVGSGYANWKAFNRTTTNDDDGWAGKASNSWIGYSFTNPICVKAITIKNKKSSAPIPIKDFKLQGSNDKSTWDDIQSFTNPNSGSEQSAEFNVANDDYYLHYRIFVTSSYSSYACVGELQFYGRALNVSVPAMTSNTAPYGEAGASSVYSSGHEPYRPFANITHDNTGDWVADEATGMIYYKFISPICVKKVIFSNRVYNNSDGRIRTFNIQASNDGTNWVDLTDVIDRGSGADTSGYQTEVNIDSSDSYVFFALNGLSTFGTRIGVGKLQFYGVDYSEKEFEAGTSRKWLYDHGVELETMTAVTVGTNSVATKNSDNVYVEVSANTSRFAGFLSTAIDLTNYSLLRAVSGDELYASTGGATMMLRLAVMDTASPTYSTTPVAYSDFLISSNDNLPNNLSVDLSSIDQLDYPAIAVLNNTSSVKRIGTVKEMWLE